MNNTINHELVKDIEYNDDLKGFILTLHDNRTVQVQYDLCTDRLNADYGTYSPSIDYCNGYDLDLNEEETDIIKEFIRENKEIQDKSIEIEEEAESLIN